VLPQAPPLSACAGPTAHLSKRSMRLPCAKPPTAAHSSHHATHNLPELTTRRGELTKRYTNQVQSSTSHTKWNANKYTSLSHQEPACKCSSNGIPERSSTAHNLFRSNNQLRHKTGVTSPGELLNPNQQAARVAHPRKTRPGQRAPETTADAPRDVLGTEDQSDRTKDTGSSRG